MSEHTSAPKQALPPEIDRSEWLRIAGRCFRYLAIRSIIVFLTVCVGIYAAIWVTNLGGAGDQSRRDDIEAMVAMSAMNPNWRNFTREEREIAMQQMYRAAFIAADLDKPFFIRSFRYFREAFLLSPGDEVLEGLLEALPRTLLILGFANLITFFAGFFIALSLSRRYGSLIDRATTLLVPLFAAPPWFHGLFLIVIFAILLRILPFGGWLGASIPRTSLEYALTVMKHMILPIVACVLGTLPFAVYTNRALFLIHSTDDHVELARGKGLGARRLQRRYVLRPTLPAVITNFAFLALVAWESVILTEIVFNWPGLGSLVFGAIRSYNVAFVIGAVTMLAYLLGFTILFLDIIYVLVDPRIRVGGPAR
jgi:peptide/nickel transport system permease protein